MESEYFLAHLTQAEGLQFQFEINAFLSASRSVTFYLQSAMSEVRGFKEWYEQQQLRMKKDAAMRFFLELRNVSQKQGPVSYVGGGMLDGGWSYRFVSQKIQVPSELSRRDICECCAEHLEKLSNLVLDCYKAFPFDSCIGQALTEEGMATLGYTISDIEICLGLPAGYLEIDFPLAEKLRALSREIDPLETEELKRLASGQFLKGGIPLNIRRVSGNDLVDDIAQMVGSGEESNSKITFIKAFVKRINEIEKGRKSNTNPED